MSLTFLTSHAMVAVSHDMLTDPAKLSLLENDELTKALVGQIRDTHHKLSAVTKADGELQTRVQKIIEELRQCDHVHDRIARGIHRCLEGAADLSPTADEGRPFTDTRESLFPTGLAINALSYREESGNVLKVAQQLTPPVRATLEAVTVHGHSLAKSFDVWVENGAQMGKLVAERASLSGDEDDTRVSAGDVRGLRNRWARVMNVLVSTLDLIDLPEPDRRRLLSNLRDAEAAALRTRAAEQRPQTQPNSEESHNPATNDTPADEIPPLAATASAEHLP